MDEQGVRIRITSEQDVVAELNELLRQDGIPVLASGPVDNPGRLALDFDTVASLVTITSTLFFDGAIVPGLLRLLKRNPNRRIIVDGPAKRIEIEYREDVTEQQLRDDLRTLAAL